MSSVHTKLISRVRSLLERNERITHDDCRDLFEVKDILALARMARVPHERRHGRQAYYHDAWVAEYRGEHPEFFIEEIATAAPEGLTDVRVRCRWLGGETLAVWKDRFGHFSRGRMRFVAALSPGFIVRLAAYEGITPAAVLAELAAAAPLAISGEEAELFESGFRADYAPGVISVDEWITVHRAAHRLGMKTTAAMTYSTNDHPAEYAHHLNAVRTLQDESGGFDAFAPLALHNRNVPEFHLAAPTAAQTLRMAAISRIFLDNIPHIIASPALVTLEVAVVALSFGADMIDTSIAVEDVHAEESAGAPIGAAHDAMLPIFDEHERREPFINAALVRARISEARWTPVVCTADVAGRPMAVK